MKNAITWPSKRYRFKGKGTCDLCKHESATRIRSWSLACDQCFIQNNWQYYSNQPRIDESRFPNKHRGYDKCSECRVDKGGLTLVYDECDDEWLFCAECKKFKQLLRCWNQYTNSFVDYLERPIIKNSKNVRLN